MKSKAAAELLIKLSGEATASPWNIQVAEKEKEPSLIWSPNKRAWDSEDEEYNTICRFDLSHAYDYGCDPVVEFDAMFIAESRNLSPQIATDLLRAIGILSEIRDCLHNGDPTDYTQKYIEKFLEDVDA